MATRQEIQIAQDLIRFVNIVNDLMDVAAYTLQNIDAQTGEQLQMEDTPGTFRDTTFEELRDRTVRLGQNVGGYKVQIITFLDSVDQALVVSGLSALGVNASTLRDDLIDMNTVRNYVASNLPSATTKADLVTLGQHIDANVPKLTLVRRSWCLGL